MNAPRSRQLQTNFVLGRLMRRLSSSVLARSRPNTREEEEASLARPGIQSDFDPYLKPITNCGVDESRRGKILQGWVSSDFLPYTECTSLMRHPFPFVWKCRHDDNDLGGAAAAAAAMSREKFENALWERGRPAGQPTWNFCTIITPPETVEPHAIRILIILVPCFFPFKFCFTQ